jgi:PAS domain S-box-containing protein
MLNVNGGRASPLSELSPSLQRLLPSSAGLLDRIPIGIYVCDREGRLVECNRRAAELCDRSPGLGGMESPLSDAYEPAAGNGPPPRREPDVMREVLHTGTPAHGLDFVLERRGGDRLILHADLDPLIDEDGRIVGGVNCFHDITGQKRSEQSLRDNEQQLRNLLEALPVAIYTTDAAGHVTFCNRAAIDLAGRAPELGSDKWCVTWRLYWPDGRPMPHDACPMATTLKENRAVRDVEAIAERPDGTRVAILPHPSPLRDRSGNLVGAVNMLIDISSRKDAELRQRAVFDELNHRVKNNMQLLYSLLHTVQRETESGEAKRVLSDLIRRVCAMGAAQQVLYGADRPSHFETRAFLQSVCASSRSLLDSGIGCEIEAACDELPNDVAMPLALILSELLAYVARQGSNGKTDPVVKVGLTKDSDQFSLYVEGGELGFESEAMQKRSSGAGLVNGLAHQLGGNFEVARTPAARYAVHFPHR